MAKYPVGGGGDFKRASPGMHVAVCTMIVDIGWQPGGQYGPKPKVYFGFKIPGETVEYTDKAGNTRVEPVGIGTTFTASMNKKALMRIALEGWRSRKFTDEEAADFDVKNVLGKPCMLNVAEEQKDGNTYSNIVNINPMPNGMDKPDPLPVLYYGPDDKSQYTKLPEWLQKKIQSQLPEPAAKTVEQHAVGLDDFEDSEIPF